MSKDKEIIDFGFSEYTNAFLNASKFEQLTEVQRKVIPAMLSNKDVVVKSFTGSGKTLSFLIPILETLHKKIKDKLKANKLISLIISPTRELATQIHDILKNYVEYFRKTMTIHTKLLIGGDHEDYDEEINANIIVGTPGRLNKYFQEASYINYKEFYVLVLDEADRLLESNYEKDIEGIFSKIPKQRRTGLFSATDCELERKLGLRNCVEINVVESIKTDINCPIRLENSFLVVSPKEKLPNLLELLKKHHTKKTIVFFLTCFTVDYMYHLVKHFEPDLKIFSIHGKMAKNKRERMLKEFKNSQNTVLFTTDLMARGIDIVEIKLIVQFDVPQNPDFFVHRIGRTGRMGRKGETITFLMPFEKAYLNVLKDLKIPICEEKTKIEITAKNVHNSIREMAKNDRDVLQKGVKAYTSYIRGYKEHRCKSVLNFSQLPFGQIATAFGLLYMPKIRDIREYPKKTKGAEVSGFEGGDMDVSEIKFLDKNRQKMWVQHQERVAEKRMAKKREEQERRRMKEKKTKEGVKRRRRIGRSNTQKFWNEWDELHKEEQLYKKFKKGKISKKEYEIAVGERKRD